MLGWVCVSVYVMPNHFNKSKAFAMIHHLSTALSALQQCLVFPPRAAFPPSQHDTKTVYSLSCAYRTLQPRMPMCVWVCVGVHAHACVVYGGMGVVFPLCGVACRIRWCAPP